MARRALGTLTFIIAVALLFPVVTLADGDPASDVLLAQSVFYPYDAAVSANLQSILTAATAAARRARFPVKVALIRAPQDLGAARSLFNKPQTYANFLYDELGAYGGEHPPLLIVMPDGYGIQGMSSAARTAASSVPKPAGNQSDDLARAAIAAIEKLAAAAGYPIKVSSVPKATQGNGGHVSRVVTVVIFALIAVAIAVAVIRYRQMQAPSG